MRTHVVAGSASGIGPATAGLLRARGDVLVGVDRHHAEVIADLSIEPGRQAMVGGVTARSGGQADAAMADAGLAFPTAATLAVNDDGALATPAGLPPLTGADHTRLRGPVVFADGDSDVVLRGDSTW